MDECVLKTTNKRTYTEDLDSGKRLKTEDEGYSIISLDRMLDEEELFDEPFLRDPPDAEVLKSEFDEALLDQVLEENGLVEASVYEEESEYLSNDEAQVEEDILTKGPYLFIEDEKAQGTDPLYLFDMFGLEVPDLLKEDVNAQWSVLYAFLKRQFRHRRRLSLNSFEEFLELLDKSKNVLVLTGAGISVSCGIPDFRSSNGIYKRLREEYSLPDPESMFDIEYFRDDPKPFYSFAKVKKLSFTYAGNLSRKLYPFAQSQIYQIT
jgi:hypothetical protein